MKVLILDAGLATRLRPLTNDKPKALLSLTSQHTILDKHLENVMPCPAVDAVYVVTNGIFYEALEKWIASSKWNNRITIVSNGITDESQMKGPFGDVLNFIEQERIGDDLLIIGSDNLLAEDTYEDILEYFADKKEMTALASTLEATNMSKQENDLVLNDDGERIIDFRHKASPPYASPYFASFIYLIPKEKLGLIKEYMEDMSYSPDPVEHFIGWAVKKDHTFLAYKLKGMRLDTGTMGNYESAKNWFMGKDES